MTRVQPNITRHGPWVKSHPSDPDEVWKKTTVSDKYDVSSYGRVRNAKRGNVLRQRKKKRGYKTVFFQKKSRYVHRLMALVFLGKPSEGQISVDHIDRKPWNNQISNLRWATRKEQRANTEQSRRKGLGVFCIDIDTSTETEYVSMGHAAESMALICSFAFNTLRQRLGQIVNKGEPYLGRMWFYMDQPVGEIRAIPSAPGYFVSSCGLVQGLYGRWTRGWSCEGYMLVTILSKGRLVHRLVAEAFLGAPSEEDTVVNHKNGKTCDNVLENLEYASPQENTQHAYATGLMETTKVLRICKDSGEILQEHDSVKDAMLFVGNKYGSHIGECCLGKCATAYGFRWSYPGESEKYAHLVKPIRKILRICKTTGKVLQEHASISEANSFVGGDIGGSITSCCMGRKVSAHGFKWSYVGEESTHVYAKRGKALLQICKDTGEVLQKHESQKEAALFVNGDSSAIGACCRGKRKTSGGFRWKFA